MSPANLPAEAKAKWLKVLEAKTPEERLRALQEFLSAVPKHKGTEKLRREIKRKIAKLRREIESIRKKRSSMRRVSEFTIKREADVQVVVIGLPNSGKSSLVSKLTKAKTTISPVPFSTLKPIPGMLISKGVLIQLIDTPPLFEGISEGKAWGPQLFGLIRNADAILIVLDAKENPAMQLKIISRELENEGILIVKPKCEVKIKRMSGINEIKIIGELEGCSPEDVRKLLRTYRIFGAIIKIKGKATLDDIENALFEERMYKPTIIVVNKVESEEDYKKAQLIKHYLKGKIPVLEASIKTINEQFKDKLAETILKTLDLIRVYTKEPGKPPSTKPLVVKRGTRVIEIAARIHSFLYKNFKYAKVWSKHLPFSPQKVGAEYILHDEDIVEIHA